MPHILRNNHIEVTINLPHEGYNQPRFDWTGKIIEVKYKGVNLCGYEKEDVAPGEFIGRGFYNEFGIERPVGFDELREGEWFHKIGIGLLQKEGKQYAFHHSYNIKPLKFNNEGDEHSLSISCDAPVINGHGYRYVKKVVLLDHGFEIEYDLENTGDKVIETAGYNHNFIMIGNDRIGVDYTLKFPFKLKPGLKGEVINPNKVVAISHEDIGFNDVPESPFFYSYLNGDETVKSHWQLINKKLGIGMSETGSFTTAKVNLWGWGGAISPELFIDIQLNPGESRSWKRTYLVFNV